MGTRQFRRRSYTTYSIACALVWGVILTVVEFTGNASRRDVFRLLCFGWVIGWLSATIARVVYPPPRSRLPAAPPSDG